jgi:hypothetical protein
MYYFPQTSLVQGSSWMTTLNMEIDHKPGPTMIWSINVRSLDDESDPGYDNAAQ